MSAYIVHKRLIDLLLTAASDRTVREALKGIYRDVTDEGMAEAGPVENRSVLGRYLLSINARSVQYRYRGDAVENLPADMAYVWKMDAKYSPLPDYEYVPTRIGKDRSSVRSMGGELSADRVVELSRVLGAAHCYAYQSCELPEWSATPAKVFMDELVWQVAGELGTGWGSVGDLDGPSLLAVSV